MNAADCILPFGQSAGERVDFADFDIKVDSPYADTNWMKDKYDSTPLYLSNASVGTTRIMAERLQQANEILKRGNIQILIWDGYRPVSAQQILWDWGEKNLDGPTEQYIGFPGKSDHNVGLAVDLTLADLSGDEIEMPSKFDHFEPAYAHPPKKDAAGNLVQPEKWSTAAFENWEKLHTAMESVGLTCHPEEWWHYSPVEWEAAKAVSDDARHQFLRDFGFKRLLTQDELKTV